MGAYARGTLDSPPCATADPVGWGWQLDIMLERGKEGRLRSILREIRERVANGSELSDAFDHFGSAFPPLYAPSLKAGERSGEIEKVIRRFIRYQKLMLETRRKVISAIVYPTVLMGLSMAMVGVMSLYVIPQFEDFFGAPIAAPGRPPPEGTTREG